jgi:hypothetical protein
LDASSNQRIDSLPRLAYLFRQTGQIAIARDLLLATTPRVLGPRGDGKPDVSLQQSTLRVPAIGGKPLE